MPAARTARTWCAEARWAGVTAAGLQRGCSGATAWLQSGCARSRRCMGWRAVGVRGTRHLFGQLNSRSAKPRQVVEVEQVEAVTFAAAVAASSKITSPCGPSVSGA
eukprot:scaffold3386_cov59-Phaeocystis_antarctica.AAC.4